jgi:inhibitor of the pro-sigma K processing machinery
MDYLKIAVIAIVVILLAKYVFKINGKKLWGLIINSLIGLAVLWLINWTGLVSIPLNIVTVLVAGIFGAPGVLVLLLLAIFHVI